MLASGSRIIVGLVTERLNTINLLEKTYKKDRLNILYTVVSTILNKKSGFPRFFCFILMSAYLIRPRIVVNALAAEVNVDSLEDVLMFDNALEDVTKPS